MRRKSFWKEYLILFTLVTGIFFLDILVGSVKIPFSEIPSALWSNSGTNSDIIWQFRLPKAITCVLAGGALAAAGLMMQTLFRNPLAGPDVLGLSSGASLVVAILIFAGQSVPQLGSLLFNNPWSLAIGASVGGGLVFLLVIGISNFVKDNASLLIIGLMIGALTTSLVSIMQYVSKAEDLQTFMIWSLGNVGNTSWNELLVLFIIVLVGLAISFASVKSLNIWLLGENYAVNLGLKPKYSRFLIVVSTGLLTGGVTAFCGPIAFVGLAVPHLIRLIIPTTNHKILLPAVVGGGASLLLLCDLIAQLPGSSQVLPLNAVTSLIGAPVVIWMIIKLKRIHV
jgi:iron complex transport system permease protein